MFLKKFDQDFVNKLIKQKESQTLDFKQKITSREKIAKTLSAMANSEGGLILIGLSDQRKIIGIDPEEERYMVEAANEEFCIPKASISVQEVKIYEGETSRMEKSVLLVEVFKTDGPLIFVKRKDGEPKAFKRENDQTLAL
jgi:predicted HTH transcriptional regulator